jgi:hypothetical protein
LPGPESSAIAESLKVLNLSEKEPKQMFPCLGAIFRQAEKEGDVVLVDELRIIFEEPQDNIRVGNRDVEALRLAKGALDQMWESRSKHLTEAAKVLADASRDRTLQQPL